MTPQAKKFKKANDTSLVVSGAANGAPNFGGSYTLEDGKHFKLTLEDAQSLPVDYPKWKL